MDEFLLLSAKISSSNILKSAFLCVSILSLHFAVLFGPQSGIVVWLSYVLGFYAFYYLLNHVSDVKKVLSVAAESIFRRTKINERNNSENYNGRKSVEFLVSAEIDSSLEQLLNRVLNQYLSNWYSNISADPCFEHEIRNLFQNIASVCFERMAAVEAEDFILKKALPIILDHINCYEQIKTKTELTQVHVAAHSRKSEISYLQNVSKCLLKYIIPKQGLRCKSYFLLLREILSRSLLLSLSDAICNPNVINTLLLYCMKGDFHLLSSEDETRVELVHLLKNFACSSRVRNQYSAIRPDLGTIMKDETLSHIFMRFLRNFNADNFWQFCIDIESFNERIAQPNLEAKELDCLFKDAWDLYSVYFSHHSPNCIRFESDHASTLRKTLSKDILKLRNSTIFQEAQEYAFLVLDRYCFDFYNSNEFHAWLYGKCDSFDGIKSDNSLSKSRLSPIKNAAPKNTNKPNKMKISLKTNTIREGQILTSNNDLADLEIAVEVGEDARLSSSDGRNLSMWKINIPTVGSRLDPITNKAYTVFVIQIQTADDREWVVERRPIDFYSLDVKLNEFHGIGIDAQLPPRRLLTTRLESIQLYEEYLDKLIKNPILKNSELLYTFLTSLDEFEGEDTSFGKLFRKSMVTSLRKERGQNLEQFLHSFIDFCRTTKYEWKDVSEKRKVTKIRSGYDALFDNNFNIDTDASMNFLQLNGVPPTNNGDDVVQPSNLCVYLGVKLYNINIQTTKFLLSVLSVFGGVFDLILIRILKRLLTSVLTSCNIAYLISLIEWVIFTNHSKIDPETVNNSVIEHLHILKGSWLHPIYVLIYDTTQDPKMNKQLYYRLLDAMLTELFPELQQF